jgi:hypothetical protein
MHTIPIYLPLSFPAHGAILQFHHPSLCLRRSTITRCAGRCTRGRWCRQATCTRTCTRCVGGRCVYKKYDITGRSATPILGDTSPWVRGSRSLCKVTLRLRRVMPFFCQGHACHAMVIMALGDLESGPSPRRSMRSQGQSTFLTSLIFSRTSVLGFVLGVSPLVLVLEFHPIRSLLQRMLREDLDIYHVCRSAFHERNFYFLRSQLCTVVSMCKTGLDVQTSLDVAVAGEATAAVHRSRSLQAQDSLNPIPRTRIPVQTSVRTSLTPYHLQVSYRPHLQEIYTQWHTLHSPPFPSLPLCQPRRTRFSSDINLYT